MLSGKLQTGLDMYWLQQEDTTGNNSMSAKCITDGSLCEFGSSSLQIIHKVPLSSSRVFAYGSYDCFDLMG